VSPRRAIPARCPAGDHQTERMTDFIALPLDLPVPLDDGAAAHLPGQRMPGLELPATAGCHVRLDQLGAGRTVLYLFPRMGQPGQPLPTDWDLIPGARGCTPEACAFRDHHDDLATAGASVFGLSSQNTTYQAEAVDRLHLPFALLSDTALALAQALNLPTFDVDDQHHGCYLSATAGMCRRSRRRRPTPRRGRRPGAASRRRQVPRRAARR
jgi:peroxiredoxin